MTFETQRYSQRQLIYQEYIKFELCLLAIPTATLTFKVRTAGTRGEIMRLRKTIENDQYYLRRIQKKALSGEINDK